MENEDGSSAGIDLSGLRSRLAGAALAPGDAGWDASRAAWNVAADQHPAAVVLAESADDVARTLEFARDSGLRVAPQGTGHGAGPLPGLEDAILLRLSRLGGVEVDVGAGTATVGAGSAWADVVGPAGAEGLVCLHGSSGTVGVAGYVLGGGLGWLGRSRGFACNNVRSIEAVTADGRVVRASPEEEGELFWALRGGGGAEAVVTSFELELCPLEFAYAGSLMWPIERAEEIVSAWRDLTASAPEELTSWMKLIRFPPFPQVPEPLRGRALVAVTSVFDGGEEEGASLLAPLRSVTDPYLDSMATVPGPALADVAGDPQDPMPAKGLGRLVERLDDDALAAYVDLAGPGADVPLVFVELRHLGGALSRPAPGAGALDAVAEPYLLSAIGPVMGPDAATAIDASFAEIADRMDPWLSSRTLLGFAEQQPGRDASFPDAVARRLEAAKESYDPDGLILANHEERAA